MSTRAVGIFHGLEPGDLQELPLTEDSDLRTSRNVYSPQALKQMRGVYTWVDDEYDKIPVEEAILADSKLPGTVLRLPMIYGPGDPLHRFYQILKRIDDGRKQILFADDVAAWRTPRGYVEDVAAAIVLAVISPQAGGRIYNVCEEESFGELEWARKIAAAANWQGEFLVLPHDQAPGHLHASGNAGQHWVATSARIRTELGFQEILPRDQSIRRTIAWERANPAPIDLEEAYKAEDDALTQYKATA
jgi:nucleoside-diphosphate-sugar epimerase